MSGLLRLPGDDRAILETIRLEQPIEWAGQELAEIVIYEPTGHILRRLSQIESRNAVAKNPDQVQDPFPVIFEHITSLPDEILSTMPLRQANRITEAIARAMGADSGDDSGEG